ncbi:metallophosphoesterase [Chloroflexota bacterium]
MTDEARVVDLTAGTAMIVTDLHGAGDAYAFYRDHFLRLYQQGVVDRLILCGDLIHGYGPAHDDTSLDMIQDVMRLQAAYGPDAVIMMLGNHEIPHLYDFPLSKGSIEFTPRFETALVQAGTAARARIIAFIDGLPFFVRTAAGVMLGHCGPAQMSAMPHNRERLANFSHQDVLARWQAALVREDAATLRPSYERMSGSDYDENVQYYLSITDQGDTRYWNLLRAIFYNKADLDFGLLWDTFFSRNEGGLPPGQYDRVLDHFLTTWSAGAPALQNFLVSGHIAVSGGHRVIADRQLRMASWAHAHPHETGVYLLLDCGKSVSSMADLTAGLGGGFSG